MFGVRLLSVNMVVAVVVARAPFLNTLYPATGLFGSMEAVQESPIDVRDVEMTETLPGTDGGVMSVGMEGFKAATMWLEAAPLEASVQDMEAVPAEASGPTWEAAPKPAVYVAQAAL